MKIQTLNTTPPPEKRTAYSNLPDVSAMELVADRLDLAKNCRQKFTLEELDWKRHQRALCVGTTNTENAIALFYISDNGLYAWARIDHLYIELAECMNRFYNVSIVIGMTYWITQSNRGEGYYKLQELSTASDIRTRYIQLHTPPVDKSKLITNTKEGDDDANGAPLALHPIDDLRQVKSFDELGL